MSALREILARFSVSVDAKPLDGLSSSIDGVVGKLGGLASWLTGGLLAAGFTHFITGTLEEADALTKQARALGLSLQQMQEWSYVASLGGASAEALTGALSKISAGKFDDGIAKLGIKTKDAAGQMRDSGDVLEDIADALDAIKNPAERNRKAVTVLGKNYTALIPILEGGGDSVRKLRQEFQELGGGFDEDFAKNAEEFNDNLTRLKVTGKSFAIQIVGQLLPTLLHLSQRFVQLLRPMVITLKNSNAIKAAMGLLAVKGVLVLSKAIGPLGQAMRTLTTRILPLIIAFLLLEDAMGFLEERDSLIGRFLDKAFGPGTSEKVRKWINDVRKDFSNFIDDIKGRPQKLADDWALFTSTLSKDMRAAFGGWGDLINSAGALFLFFIDLVTGGWDNLVAKLKAADDGILLIYKILWTELKNGFLGVVAAVEDAFTRMWNTILSGAQTALGVVQKAAGIVPGLGGVGDKIGGLIQSLESSKGAGDAVERARNAASADRLNIAAEGDRIGSRLGAGLAGPSVQGGNVYVTVPPGTPEQVANRVGQAAQKGTQKSLNAVNAALTGGG